MTAAINLVPIKASLEGFSVVILSTSVTGIVGKRSVQLDDSDRRYNAVPHSLGDVDPSAVAISGQDREKFDVL